MKAPSDSYEIPMPRPFMPSRFFMGFCPSLARQPEHFRDSHLRSVMLLNLKHPASLDSLENELRCAGAADAELTFRVIDETCLRFNVQGGAAKAKVRRLIECGAWTDVTLALLELDLPQWKLRRLLYEDGEWHCALSRDLALPFGFDERVETSHESLPLAILLALVEARHAVTATVENVSTVPQVRAQAGHVVCCDNFA